MLGWVISVHRQAGGGVTPADAGAVLGSRLAVWQTGVNGLRWLDELASSGRAVSLGGNGYPMRYTAQAALLIPRIADGPPMAKESWVLESGSIALPSWPGKTVIDQTAIDACRPDEWLLIEAWDES